MGKADEEGEAVPEIMTIQEVADWLRIPLGTVYNWRTRGEGPPAARVGRHLRYRRSDVEAWLARRARDSA